jgi:hypothetical protein
LPRRNARLIDINNHDPKLRTMTGNDRHGGSAYVTCSDTKNVGHKCSLLLKIRIWLERGNHTAKSRVCGRGYVLKATDEAEMIQAIRAVGAGKAILKFLF